MWWDNRDVFYVLICCAYFLFIYLFFFRSNWIRTPPQWPRSCLLPFLICTIFFCRGDSIPQCRYIATHANEYDASCRDHHKVTTFDDHTIFIQWFSWNVSVLIQHRWCPQANLLPLNINDAFTSSIEQMWFWLLNSVDSICRENVRLIFQTYFFFQCTGKYVSHAIWAFFTLEIICRRLYNFSQWTLGFDWNDTQMWKIQIYGIFCGFCGRSTIITHKWK